MSRLDRTVIWICVAIVVAVVALPVAHEGPMFARCTQAALDILQRVEPAERRPPPWLRSAVDEALTPSDLALAAASMSMRNSRCNAPAHRSVERLFEVLGLSVWWRLRFSHEDIVALYVSEAWLGTRPVGFGAASRSLFGRDLNPLTPDQQRCLVQKLRSPDPRAFTCERGT